MYSLSLDTANISLFSHLSKILQKFNFWTFLFFPFFSFFISKIGANHPSKKMCLA